MMSRLFLMVVAFLVYGVMDLSMEASVTPPFDSKQYVDPSHVKVTKDGIYIQKGNVSCKVRAVRANEQGLFILESDYVQERKNLGEDLFQCEFCGKVFPDFLLLEVHWEEVHPGIYQSRYHR